MAWTCVIVSRSGGCYDALSESPDGVVDSDVSACVEEGDVLVFEGDPSVSPVLFAVSRSMWEGALVNAPAWREFVVAAGACGCRRRRVEVATVAARELLCGGRA